MIRRRHFSFSVFTRLRSASSGFLPSFLAWLIRDFACPPFLALILVIIDDWRLSSMKTKVSSSIKPDFRYKRSFLSIAVAKLQLFGIENKLFRYRFWGRFHKCLIDNTLSRYFGNRFVHFDRF